MTREEAIDILEDLLYDCKKIFLEDWRRPKDEDEEKIINALNFAIESLKVDLAYDLAYEKAESDREKGHWIVDVINWKALYSCSCCGRDITYAWGYHYCPACGAKLEGEEIIND